MFRQLFHRIFSGHKRMFYILILCIFVAGLLVPAATLLTPQAAAKPANLTGPFNYAEALQKSIYFYDAEKSGPGITGGYLVWRGDSEPSDSIVPLKPWAADKTGTNMSAAFIAANKAVLDPDGNGSLDLHGGFHDAGDHVKFGLPQSYAISTLGWGYNEFKDAFVASGQNTHMLNELKWGADYLLRSTFRNSSGAVVAFAYQVGEGDVDHGYWGPPELQDPALWPRGAHLATSETPASDQAAGASAALTIMYFNYKDVDATYAAKCLDTAKALYAFAKQYRGLGYSGGFYGSSFDEDELTWAAAWLYQATSDMTYINEINATDASGNYTGYMKRIIGTPGDTWVNIWVHSWDTVWGGAFMKLATLFPANAQFEELARWNVEFLSGGGIPHKDTADTAYVAKTPAGFSYLNGWGSARYNAAMQLEALVYAKSRNRPDYAAWAKTQMDYLLGNNPMGYSYEVGFPSPAQAAQHPHNRAAHGSTTNSMTDPATHRHILWGALVGGPAIDDTHHDATTDYVSNEVSVDYNAGFVGALAGIYHFYGSGQQPLANFPPAEAQSGYYSIGARMEQENTERSQVTITLYAEEDQPPQYLNGMTARYFFNINELAAFGQTINDVSGAIMYDEQASSYTGAAKLNGPFAWDAANGVYYMEVDWNTAPVRGKRDFQFAIIVKQASDYKSHWDPTNDYSRQGLVFATTSSPTTYIPIYHNGVKIMGQEPPILATPTPCSNCPTATPTTPPAVSLKVQYKAGDTAASTSQIKPFFTIYNMGTGAVALSALKVRYWFTADGASGQTWTCDYAAVTCAKVTGVVNSMGTAQTGADSYMEVSFASSAGNITPGGNSGEVQNHVSKSDFTNYTQTGDYSFDATKTAYADWNKITLYYNGTLVWGAEPGGVAIPTNTPTRTPTSAAITLTPTRTPTAGITSTPITGASPTRTVTPPAITLTPTRTLTLAITNTPTRTSTAGITNTPTRTLTPPAITNTPTRTPTTGVVNTPTRTLTPGTGTCSPVTSTITAPFTQDGVGTFCWQSTNLGTYINSWNTTSVTLNSVNVTNLYVAVGSYPAKINGYWYVSYTSASASGHFEAK
jgi:hypothetical protein